MLTSLTNLAHRVVARPVIYDIVQKIAGSEEIRRHLRSHVETLGDHGQVLDLGGGTGLYRGLWSAGWNYICLDNDPEKLRGFLRRNPQDTVLLADVTAVPMADASLDAVICTAVSHHLPEEKLDAFARESARLLRPSGTLIFLDAIWQPDRRVSRLLWAFDRGARPRTREHTLAVLGDQFELEHIEELVIQHEYIICTGRPRL
jgi:SAM-dependent methyltransferase